MEPINSLKIIILAFIAFFYLVNTKPCFNDFIYKQLLIITFKPVFNALTEIMTSTFSSITTSFVALNVLGTQSEQFSLSISSGSLGLKYNYCNGLATFFALWWFLPFMWEIMAETPICSIDKSLLLQNLHTALCLSLGCFQ